MSSRIPHFFKQSYNAFNKLPKNQKFAVYTGSSLISLYLALEAFECIRYQIDLSYKSNLLSLKSQANQLFKGECE